MMHLMKGSDDDSHPVLKLIFISLLLNGSYQLFTRAFQVCDASKLAPFFYMVMVFTSIFETLSGSESHSWWQLLGIIIIIVL